MVADCKVFGCDYACGIERFIREFEAREWRFVVFFDNLHFVEFFHSALRLFCGVGATTVAVNVVGQALNFFFLGDYSLFLELHFFVVLAQKLRVIALVADDFAKFDAENRVANGV